MKVFYSHILDPYVNLAMEKWLMKRTDLHKSEVLMFYRNAPSVILGRFQNPWLECDLEKMKEDDVNLVRRESGGGAVYHDPGNLNFSFITDKDLMEKEERTTIVLEALKSLGFNAAQGKRNDIYVDGKKVSGSAGKYTSKRALHHGTLLIDADLNALNNYLLAEDYRTGDLKSRGTASIQSEVTNLRTYNESISHKEIIEAITEKASLYFDSPVEKMILKPADPEVAEEIEEYRSTLSGWDWIFGKTPTFTIIKPVKTSGPERKCHIEVNKGLVRNISYDSDSISEEDRMAIEKIYLGKPYDEI